jgi:TPP-dependent indolepyruvate ferredoxin oxidoreductase alpha subunit
MAKTNTSSVKTIKAEKIAATGNQNKNSLKVAFSQDKSQEKQIVNARKAVNLQLAKTKAKKKAKMVKASQRKNKK